MRSAGRPARSPEGSTATGLDQSLGLVGDEMREPLQQSVVEIAAKHERPVVGFDKTQVGDDSE